MPHFGEFSGVSTTSYAVAPASAWNPADKGASMVLSNGNRTATISAAMGGVRGTRARSAGKYMFEVQCNNNNVLVGVGLAAADINFYPGRDASGWSYYGVGAQRFNANVGIAYGIAWGSGDFIGVLYDNGTLRFAVNGADQGAAFAGIAGAVYPMYGPGTAGAGTRSCVINAGQEPFAFPIAGYSAWG